MNQRAPKNLPYLYIMCYLLHLIDEYTCQHQVLKQRQKVSARFANIYLFIIVDQLGQIDCNKEDCSLSNSHLRTHHACTETCAQRYVIIQIFLVSSMLCVTENGFFFCARLGGNQDFIMNRPPNECNRCRLGI